MFGMGLRHTHFPEILSKLGDVSPGFGLDFFEVITENFYQTEGRPLRILEKVREVLPLTFHGVSLSIASHEELDLGYLHKVRELVRRFDPVHISDHLCWTGLQRSNLHNLLPFPYSEEALRHLEGRVQKVQEFLGRTLLLENLSAYVSFQSSSMSEAQFLRELQQRTGCGILLDMNNVYVNSRNQNFDPKDWIREIPATAVNEIHLAGFSDLGTHLFDTHSCPVWPEVWELYRCFKKDFADAWTLVEWDEEIPAFEVVLAEVQKARTYAT